MDWFYNLLSEKCGTATLGQATLGNMQLCSTLESEALWLAALASFIGFVFAGASALFGWKKWQIKNKEKEQK